jgi:Family of unknown function (DUF5681)
MPPDPDYEIGYKKPPEHTRFKKGQSGNPRARPKASKDPAALLTEILDEKVTIMENGKRRRIASREVFVKQLVDRTVLGDPKAMPAFLRLVDDIDREKKQGVRPVRVILRPDLEPAWKKAKKDPGHMP